MTKNYLSENILRLRAERGWSQEKLSEEADVSYQTVFRAEKRGVVPRGGNLAKIAKALGVTESDLFANSLEVTKPKTQALTPETLTAIKDAISDNLRSKGDTKINELLDIIRGFDDDKFDVLIDAARAIATPARDNVKIPSRRTK